MNQTEDCKHYYFVDESGDPVFFDRKGNDLLQSNDVSPVFMVGFIETENLHSIGEIFTSLKEEIKTDPYLVSIPSISKSITNFHAKNDCPEVREKVFKCIKEMDFKTHVVIARKNTNQFRKKFNANAKAMYEYLVSNLFENRLHLHSNINIYFSKMGNVVREKNMRSALNIAKSTFEDKWKVSTPDNIRIHIQEPSQIAGLQVVDYMLWAVYRAYTKREMRYVDFLKEKYSLIIDIFDTANYPKNFYNAGNEFDIKKTSPLEAR